jgi:transcriptional regulator with XRE-family HTH domain
MADFEGRQLTAARALAGLTVARLAEEASVTARTINRLETGGAQSIAPKRRHGYVSAAVWSSIIDALARHGVALLAEGDGRGAGAHWIKPRHAT